MNAVRALPALCNPVRAAGRVDVRVAFALVVGVVALAAVLIVAACVHRLAWWDAWVMTCFAELRGCGAIGGVSGFTDAAPYVAALLAGTSALAAMMRGRRAESLAVCALLALALLLIQALKLLFARHRPDLVPGLDASDESFPSGHVANAAVSVAAMLRLRLPLRRAALRWLETPLAVGFVLAVGWSRLYLGRHWLTDVVAGLLLGLAFWGLSVAPTARGTRIVAAIMALVVLPSCYIACADGVRIHLHAPASFEKSTLQRSAVRAVDRLSAGDEGMVALVQGGSDDQPPFVRVQGRDAHLTLGAAEAGHDVLKIVARSLRGLHDAQCPWLEVLVDGARVAAAPLRSEWRSYAFALPSLKPEPHRVTLHVLTQGQEPAESLPVLGVAVVTVGR